jgi:pyridoxine 5-phosphate synthase
MNTTALSVNLNKVALLRNTRHLGIPSVTRAAEICMQAGAHGITVHPRPDERHIRVTDVTDLAKLMRAWPQHEFNIEGNPFHNLMDVVGGLVRDGLPVHQVTFVPDDQGQFTSDHGWRLPQDAERLAGVVAQAKAWGLRVSLFMDAEPEYMGAAKAVGADSFELYTEPFAAAWASPDQGAQLRRFAEAARAALAAGLGVNAGHDLNRENLTAFIAGVHGVSEVSIGHALIADALELGYRDTVMDYVRCITLGQAWREQTPG